MAVDANVIIFARIKEAALIGKNDEIMRFILTREDGEYSGQKQIEFMRDVQIPALEKAGFVGALAYEHYRLGEKYMEKKEYELFCEVRNFVAENSQRIQKTAALLAEIDAYYSLASVAAKNRYVRPEINSTDEIEIKDGRHPVVVLKIDLPPRRVDVNVHPTKTEIKFSDDQRIFDVVYYVTGFECG